MTLLIGFVILSFAIALFTALDFSEEDLRLFLPSLTPSPMPTCTGPNEIYRMCKTQCSDCTNRGRCRNTKCVSGCDCIPRFFRVTPEGPCEPIGNCPIPDCKENEVFRECGPVCETCVLSRCKVIGCYHKCYCKQGYLRSSNGTCIPQEECPTRNRCLRHEKMAESGPVDEYCVTKENTNVRNETQDVPGCYCMEGYKRGLMGCCMKEEMCPSITAVCFVPHQKYYDCVPKCNTTCRNYGSKDCKEDENCYPGCSCEPGYIMNDFQSCIPQQNCSLDISQLKTPKSSEKEDKGNTTSVKDDSISVTTKSVSTAASSKNTSDVSSDSTDHDGTTSTSPTEATPVTEPEEKQKSQKRDKDASHSEAKSESASETKETSKEETAPVTEPEEKQKSQKKVKDASYSEAKSESASETKDTSKQETPDDDFDNSEI